MVDPSPHASVRKAINKAMADQAMRAPQIGDPLDAWVQYKQKKIVGKIQ